MDDGKEVNSIGSMPARTRRIPLSSIIYYLFILHLAVSYGKSQLYMRMETRDNLLGEAHFSAGSFCER
jgi:hypothetical protein